MQVHPLVPRLDHLNLAVGAHVQNGGDCGRRGIVQFIYELLVRHRRGFRGRDGMAATKEKTAASIALMWFIAFSSFGCLDLVLARVAVILGCGHFKSAPPEAQTVLGY
jgi:hypothetical protein